MLKRNHKKGFTLAELLIVVAIIAVLIAIAVPLFVSGLGKANKARDDANLRNVRAEAVVQILSTEKPAADETNPIYDNGKFFACYMVVANLNEKGEVILPMTFTGGTDAKTLDSENKTTDTQGKDRLEKTDTGYKATVFITSVSLEGVASSKVGG